MVAVTEGAVLWQPDAAFREQCRMAGYMRWLASEKGRHFATYQDLWAWSATDLEGFWASMWEFLEIKASQPYTRVLDARKMPGAKWFEGARLNYAEHAFRYAADDRPALITQSELRPRREVSWAELQRDVGALAASLRAMGIREGDRVVSFMPNIVETFVAFLAVVSVGAVWSSCSPDMGAGAVVDRFRQIEPRLLFAVDGYRYGGKDYDRRAVVAELEQAMPTLERVVLVSYLDAAADPAGFRNGVAWSAMVAQSAPLSFAQVPFDHPLWIVYSSGTTGLPKAIVHGHGGVLIEHLKTMVLHEDLYPGDRFFWMSSTGWIVWNLLASGLLAGCTLVVFDGHAAYPDWNTLWRICAETRTKVFGAGAAFFNSCMKAGLAPARDFDLSSLVQISSTGSPLSTENYAWLYGSVKHDLWLTSMSGGTDPAAGFVGGCPLLPVTAGEMQAKYLGMAVHAYDEAGRSVIDEVGELVIAEPFPSMPLYFWNDAGGRRYHDSYFEMYPGKWRHGDWIRLTADGRSVIFGRSDTTINRFGIRMGTSEIYRAVEEIPEVLDSMVVDLEYLGRESFMPLFVVLREGSVLDAALEARIRESIRTRASARHVPNKVYAVAEIPRTLTGKKMELPVRKLLLGQAVEKIASPDAMANPASLAFYVALAKELNA